MQITSQSVRRWALRCLLAVWTLFFLGVLVPIVTSVAQRHADLDQVADAIWTRGVTMVHLASAAWFAWPAAGILGLVTGLFVGVWLDALLRRREERAPRAATDTAVAGGVEAPSPPPARHMPPDGFEWLSWAAPTMYGNLGKCYVRDKIDAIGKNEEGITNVVARMIAQFADVYGRRAPSRVLAPIDHDEVERLNFELGAMFLRAPDTGRTIWTDLAVLTTDLRRAEVAIMNARHSSALQIR